VEKFADLKNRLIMSVLTITFLTVFIIFAQHTIMQLIVLVLVSVIGVWAISEYVDFLRTKSIELPFKLMATFTVLLIWSNGLLMLPINLFGINQIMLGLCFFIIFLYYFSKAEGAIVNIATCFFGLVYILVPLCLMVRILYPETIVKAPIDGRIWLAYLLIVTKITDIGGYFLGTRWGVAKIAPKISPKKTFVGAFGGLSFAMSVSLIFFLISYFFTTLDFHLTFLEAVILGGLIGIFGQIGDLAESLLKRDAKVKDSNTLPGFGGVLDSLDSLLFTAPIVYTFIKHM
jgi:phosphatidate cytidylyltransferase